MIDEIPYEGTAKSLGSLGRAILTKAKLVLSDIGHEYTHADSKKHLWVHVTSQKG